MTARRLVGRCNNRRGLALVTVLWVLMLLSLVAANFSRTTRTEVNLTRNLLDNAAAEALADAGVYRALLGLAAASRDIELGEDIERLLATQSEPSDPLDDQPDTQAQQEEQAAEPEEELAENSLWQTDGTVYAWSYAGGEVQIAIRDEGGKIDLNASSDDLLRGLFLSVDFEDVDGAVFKLDDRAADALVNAIRDFADEDDLTRLNGAEDRDYAAAGLAWGAKDASFESVAELQQVLGMRANLYEAVAPALTVHSGRAGIDPAKASRTVLLALPGSDALAVDEYLAARAEAAEGAGPVFAAAEGFAQRSNGRVFTIRSEARSTSGAVFARRAIVRLGDSRLGYSVLEWDQSSRQLFANATAGAAPDAAAAE